MGGRSGSADRRWAAVAACVAIATACTATSPPPLPPRRVDFSAPTTTPTPGDGAAGAVAAAPRASELPAAAAAAPLRDESYFWSALAANVVADVPLILWMERPKDVYLAAPALLLPPAVHALYGETRTAAVSLAMHAAMIGAVYGIARAAASDDCASSSSSSIDVCVLPLKWFLLTELAVVPVVVIDSVFMARRARPAAEWNRLPLLGASAGADGGRMLTLSGRF